MDRNPSQRPADSYTELTLDSQLPSSQQLPLDETHHLGDGKSVRGSSSEEIPESIGRYNISRLLGKGGYGRVFKAFDSQLERFVAIKVPHLYRITSEHTLDRYLDEARTLAKLEHPPIVAGTLRPRLDTREFVVLETQARGHRTG